MELILEVLDVGKRVIICLNLMDEALKRHLVIDQELLKSRLDVEVIAMSTKKHQGIEELKKALDTFDQESSFEVIHTAKIQHYLDYQKERGNGLQGVALRDLLCAKEFQDRGLRFYSHYITKMDIIGSYHECSLKVLEGCIHREKEIESKKDRILDHLLTSPWTGFPIMLLFLFVILFLTIYFSNIPSDFLFGFFQRLEPRLYALFSFLPSEVLKPLIFGGYRTLYWVISVMLPPMMIFFPLFSLLEEYGFLPRIAFNLDYPFARCGSCGKQALTMCMGLGCNAVGVTGTRIMESKKMKLMAILTNVFMPCNGRFPMMICIIHLFFVKHSGFLGSIESALILSLVILLGIGLTFLLTKILNHFILKDEKSLFILELPMYRKPKILKTIFISLKEKAVHILLRAMMVAFPAGLFIYFLANIEVGGTPLLQMICQFFNPVGVFLGVDGVILLAFLLGLPANEIVLPILILGYTQGSMLSEVVETESLYQILIMNHWTVSVAIHFLLLCLCHFPCATTLLTIKKETNSWFYMFLAFLMPTIVGIVLCFIL